MTQVLILNPPRRSDGGATLFNNATLSLSSYLHRHGISAWTAALSGPAWMDQLDELLRAHQPQIVAISCKWWDTLYGAVHLARLVRRRLPRALLVCGGQTATYFAADLVAHSDFDAVIHGDGELPLLQLAQGRPECNLTRKDGTRLPQTYVQKSGDELGFAEDLRDIADALLLRSAGYDVPFIWTGKGCRLTCLYCAGSALGHKKLFGRSGYMYRPTEQILRDIDILAPWSQHTIMFDFDPIADPDKRDYYLDLFRQLPRQRYHLHFYCWSLPDTEFIDVIAETFISAFVSLDAQAYSEAHRRRLAEQRMIKPFRDNAAFEAILTHIGSYAHMDAGLYGIVGLPGEGAEDVEAAARWIDQLLHTHGDALGELDVTPLATEPGALVHRNPDKYGMRLLRRSYQDYLDVTRAKYHNHAGIHAQEFDLYLPHPYGLHQADQPPGRVYHDYQRLRTQIDGHFAARRQARFNGQPQIFGDVARLPLHNRCNRRQVWEAIVWACQQAQSRGARVLEVDASAAFINMPDRDVLAHSAIHPYTEQRLDGLQQQLRTGAFTLKLIGRADHHWGALAEIGATVHAGFLMPPTRSSRC